MKIRMIYSEQSSSITDMSKDRIHLNLSYNEWLKLKTFIDLVRFELPLNSKFVKKAQNLSNCINHAKELPSIWIDEEGRAK